MAGIFGIFSEKDCSNDLFWGTHYLQHRAQDYCGLVVYDGKDFNGATHKGLIRQQFQTEELEKLKGNYGIGVVSSERQPLSELSLAGGFSICFDGNIINYEELKNKMLQSGISFSGYRRPEDILDIAILSKIISSEMKFENGIKKLIESIQGDFAIICLKKEEGIYAARGWGRKPLILGKKDGSYAVSSESVSFVNTGFEIVRDVKPGEIVFINDQGIHIIGNLNLQPIKYGTFEWIYNAYPTSVIDGKSVSEVRTKIGKALSKRYPTDADIVSPVPNSGRWHAIGYAQGSGLPYEECFIRFDYSDRSYTPGEQKIRDQEAKTKLIPIESSIKGKRIVLVDDSIVRGTQMINRVKVLKELGAKEVHARIACPPLMCACNYGKTTRKDEDCIARRMEIKDIIKKIEVDSLCYATVEDLEEAIGIPRENLCLECWGY